MPAMIDQILIFTSLGIPAHKACGIDTRCHPARIDWQDRCHHQSPRFPDAHVNCLCLNQVFFKGCPVSSISISSFRSNNLFTGISNWYRAFSLIPAPYAKVALLKHDFFHRCHLLDFIIFSLINHCLRIFAEGDDCTAPTDSPCPHNSRYPPPHSETAYLIGNPCETRKATRFFSSVTRW